MRSTGSAYTGQGPRVATGFRGDFWALDLASTGQLYHHVKTLCAAGWLRRAGRGQVTVPAERVVPCW